MRMAESSSKSREYLQKKAEMEIKKIYIDMDGVLADFDRGVVELAGGEIRFDESGRPTNIGSEMWEKVRKVDHFYDKLKYMPGAKEMFDSIYAEYGDKCEILTGIPKPKRGIVNAKEDKIKWAGRMLSEKLIVNAVYKEEKKLFCTGRDCILIDDLRINIDNWENAGGTGILYSSAEETLKRLKELSEQ